MNILHLSTRLNIKYGGGERFLEQFLDGFSEHNHTFLGSDSVVFNIFKKRNLESYFSPAGYEPITIKRKLIIPISFLLGIIQFIRYFKIIKNSDLILISSSSIAEPIWLIPWVRLFFPKKRVIQFMHSLCIDYYSNNPMTWLLRIIWKKIEVVFVSNSQMNSWKDKNLVGGINHVIYNGVATYNFVPKNIDKKTIKIGYIGRMYFEKGIDTMITAISKLDPKEKKIEVFMAGTGEQLEELKLLQERLSSNRNIKYKWLDFVSDTKVFYESIDLLIFPSWIESFGLTTLEAWERGVSVITSDIQTFQEVKENLYKSEKALSFKVKNHNDLLKTLDMYLYKYKEYREFSYQNYLHKEVINNFSLDNMIKNYRNLIIKK